MYCLIKSGNGVKFFMTSVVWVNNEGIGGVTFTSLKNLALL